MTGVFIRIKRDGKYENIEIEHLTDQELEDFATSLPDKGWIWVRLLVKWIRDNVGQEEVIKE